MTDNDGFVREPHHRVKNHFQIVASLVNLQRRMVPLDRRSEARFGEEHVQCMAIVYRIGPVTDGAVQVGLRDLVSEVVDALRQISDIGRDTVNVELPTRDCLIHIDRAVAMGLYVAVLVPSYLDDAAAHCAKLRVTVSMEDLESAVCRS